MRYLYLALSSLLLLAACNKTPTAQNTKENMLRAGKWKLTGGTLTFRLPSGKDTTVQYLNYVPDCYKDDYVVFDSLYFGKRYLGTTCTAADPAYYEFSWRLTDNGTKIDLYNGFNNLFAVNDAIQPWQPDTTQYNPFVIVDTVIGYLDTLNGYIKTFIEIDSVRNLVFTPYLLGTSATGLASAGYDIYNADITDFSANSFTLHFYVKATYPDSTHNHSGAPNPDPIIKPDTLLYVLHYTN